MKIIVADGRYAVAYQFRMVFGVIPPDVSTSPAPRTGVAFTRAGSPVETISLPVSKEWSFSHPVSVFDTDNHQRFLVCAVPHNSYYLAADKAERRLLGGGRVPWHDPKAKYGDFCGIVGLNGDQVFRFPFPQRRPKDLLEPLSISGDGSYAAVVVGEEVREEDGRSIGRWREIWTWEHPARLKKYPGPWKDGPPADEAAAVHEVRRKYSNKPQPK